jgi:hypothetical protein
MAGLLRDVPLMPATLGGQGGETEAQRITAELLRRETDVSNGSLRSMPWLDLPGAGSDFAILCLSA